MTEISSDEELRRKTDELLAAAMKVSQKLRRQTDELASAIDSFDQEILAPLREGFKES